MVDLTAVPVFRSDDPGALPDLPSTAITTPGAPAIANSETMNILLSQNILVVLQHLSPSLVTPGSTNTPLMMELYSTIKQPSRLYAKRLINAFCNSYCDTKNDT